MDPYESIGQRYGFEVPQLYRTLKERGHLDLPWENYLVLDDLEWLPTEEIARFEFNPWEIAADGGFVPFAITGRGEPYCWRLDWTTDGQSPVVLCERSEKAVCLAPDLGGLLYRLALEAFAGRNNFSGGTPVDELYRTVDILTQFLPQPWLARLNDLRRLPWQEDQKRGSVCVFPWQECQQVIQADLAFPHLNEKFIHDKEYLKRLKNKS